MAKEKAKVKDIEEVEVTEEVFEPEIEEEEAKPTKGSKAKSILKKIGMGIGLGALTGVAFILGKKVGREESETEAVRYLETTMEPETEEVIES
jgi:hypothetical protein